MCGEAVVHHAGGFVPVAAGDVVERGQLGQSGIGWQVKLSWRVHVVEGAAQQAHLLVPAAQGQVHGHDGEVELVGVQGVEHVFHPQQLGAQAHARRFPPHPGHEAGRHQHFQPVGGGHAHHALGARQLEIVRAADEVAGVGQPGAHARRQRQGAVGGHHALARSHQQFVVEQHAQPCQGVAHGRLADVDAFGGTRHVALGQQGVERDQQVEVDAVEVAVLDIDVVHESLRTDQVTSF